MGGGGQFLKPDFDSSVAFFMKPAAFSVEIPREAGRKGRRGSVLES